MLSYILRRILLIFPTLLGITAVVFFVMAFSPGGVGGPLLNAEGGMKSEEARVRREYYNRRYGLDLPKPVQYLRWLNHISPVGRVTDENGVMGRWAIKWPDLGRSFARGRPVSDLILEAVPITLLLNVLELPIMYGIGIVSGLYAARHRGKWFDVGSSSLFLGLWSIPVMLAGVLCIGFLANREYFYWFPAAGLHDLRAEQMAFLPGFVSGEFQRGWLLDMAWHLVLPMICYSYGGFAVLSKLTRASTLENFSADYVRTARAKGVDERSVLFRHVLANSILPLITVSASILPGLLAGSVVIETIFSINGMGKLMVDAVRVRDRELILAETLIGGLLGLLSLLLADICYAAADPRVSYE